MKATAPTPTLPRWGRELWLLIPPTGGGREGGNPTGGGDQTEGNRATVFVAVLKFLNPLPLS